MPPLPDGASAADAIDIFLIAVEESGDRLGAALMQALRARSTRPVRFSGVGGRAMAAEGLTSLYPAEDFAIIGFAAIPARLPKILRRIRETAAAVLERKPDVLVAIDSPSFSLRVAKRVRVADPSIPIVDYVSPSVWAWRPRRAQRMRPYVDHIMALLPFEPAEHRRLGGPPCTYVGHPLVEQVAMLRPNSEEALRRTADPPLVLVLPGSRGAEVRRLGAAFGEAIERVAAQAGPMDLALLTTPHLRPRVEEAVRQWAVKPRILVDDAEKRAAIRSARAALAKSGTVTLELALAGVPMVTAYKFATGEGWLSRRLLKIPTIILANLVLGEIVVPEFLQGRCTPEALANALLPLLKETPERRRQLEAFARLDSIMEIGKRTPAASAAEIVLAQGRVKRPG